MPSNRILIFLKEQFEYRYILSIFFFVFLFPGFASSQRPVYSITATLDTSDHSLKMTMNITYFNNSKVVLEEIPLHLWANAHSTRATPLVNQKLHQGDMSLLRAKKEDLGGFYNIKVTSPNQQVTYIDDPSNVELTWVQLSKTLNPGDSIQLEFSPFTLNIPKSFSRLGYTGHSYQLTQWYPHIPVLDENGWNIIPNLDQGEYFNEFADYLVAIKVPSGYIVAATGKLESTNQLAEQTQFHYKARNVIDFAAFASPDFQHESKIITLDHPVELNIYKESYLNADWDSAMVYAERAVRFYSEWLGAYPYEQMSVVHTPFSRAGFMEYPMVAQISYTDNSQLLERVIAHEIGHTWVYGILANNERKHPWMDEGLNSFLENEYMKKYHAKPEEIIFPDIIHSPRSMSDYDALQHIVRSAGNLEPPASAPERQQNDQYIFSAYQLPSQGLQLMMAQVGRDKMQQMFQRYFEENKFSHVSPGDLRSSFESACSCDLSWFFNEWLTESHRIDYTLSNVSFQKNKLTIENRSGVQVPVILSEYVNGEKIKIHWIEPFTGVKEFHLDEATDQVKLYENIPAVNKSWKRNVFPRSILPVISIVPKVGNYERPTLAITPAVGYNLADGGLAGLAFTTDLFPQPKLKLFMMPMYGIESKKLRFFGETRYVTDTRIKGFDKFLIGVNGSAFAYNIDTFDQTRDHYERYSAFAGLRFNSKPYSHTTKWLKYRYMNVNRFFNLNSTSAYDVHELSFQMNSDTVVKPYRAVASIQAGKGFVRTHIHYHQHFRGRDKMRGVWVHGFVGWLPVYNNPVADVRFGLNGKPSLEYLSKDYMYDHWLLGRNATDGNVSRQLFLRDADLKTLADLEENSNWMAGGGFSISLPLKVIHLYADAGLYNSAITDKIKLSYSGGLAIILMKDAFEIYLPIFESKDIRESITYDFRDKFLDRISFRANFNLANPLYLIDHYQFKY